MTPFWIGFLLGVWIGPALILLGLFFYAHLTRWEVPTQRPCSTRRVSPSSTYSRRD